MDLPDSFEREYAVFLTETGFENPDPQALLMELASVSLDVYVREVAWLSDFLGRLSRIKAAA